MKTTNVTGNLLSAFKTANVLRGLICAALGGVLFFIAYTLVGGFKSSASSIGDGIFLVGCWTLAEAMLPRWLFPSAAKKKPEIDLYTAALVEIKLEKESKRVGIGG